MQKNSKCKSIKSNQENLSRSETSRSCNSRTCENQPPEKNTSHVKALLKADSGNHRCEICGEFTEYTLVKIEQGRVLSDCTQCVSKHLHVLCDLCLAHVLSQSSAKSDTPKRSTGRVMPCSSSTCEFSSSRKNDESNSCQAPCNTKADSKPSSKCPNLDKAEKPYEMCYTKCSRKPATPSKRPPCEVTTKKRRMPCGANSTSNTKSEEKRETSILKPKGKAKYGDKMGNKKTSELKVSTDPPAMCGSVVSTSTDTTVLTLPENFEVFSNTTEYGDAVTSSSESEKKSYTPSAEERKITLKISCADPAKIECDNFLTSNYEENTSKVVVEKQAPSDGCQYAETCCECEDKKDNNQSASDVMKKDQPLMICETCEPCYPSVKDSIASKEQHCVECADPAKIECDNCLTSNYEDNSSKVVVENQVSFVSGQHATSCCECEDNKDNNHAVSKVMKKDHPLMICETCEPCYPSVKDSIASKEQHCVECADPAKIECDNCLTSNYEDNTSKVVVENQVSFVGGQHATSCCECEDNKDNKHAASEVMKKDQSLMICEPCEPCYPSVKDSIASKKQHCDECADPAKIECDNCLTSNYEDNTSKVVVEKQAPSDGCQYAETCCECEDDKINRQPVSEVMKKDQSLTICETCEPCYPSITDSIASKKQHCDECADLAKIECDNCLTSNYEDNSTKVVVEKQAPSDGCQYAETCCGCEDDQNNSQPVSEVIKKDQSLMICETCEPCYPSVKDSIASKEQHCVECADPAKIECDNCLTSNYEDNTSKVVVENQVSFVGGQHATSCCECEDNKDNNHAASEVMKKDQSLMIYETCEPCYPSVKDSIASKKQHCNECADPAKIECDNCLTSNYEENTSKVVVEKQVSSDGCQYAETCCECEDKKDNNQSASEVMKKDQSLMICETCEPCYPSVKDSIASKEQHCVECADPAKTECENCLTSNYEDNSSKVVVEKQAPSDGCQYAETCCKCEDDKDNSQPVSEVIKKDQSLMICETCEPCYPSVKDSIASKEQHCVECADPAKIECDNCLTSNYEDNSSKVVVEKQPPSDGCQYAETCCECEDNKDNNHAASEVMKKDQSLTICETCEPCYPSVKDSIASKKQHCDECADPAKIECDNCLTSNYEDNTSKVVVENQVSFVGGQHATSCCECEDNKDNRAVSEVKKDQSLMICETCEPCYPSVKDSISSKKQHCDECADPAKIECDNCLTSNYKDRTSKVVVKKQAPSDSFQYAGTCCECEDNKFDAVSSDQIKKVSYADDSKVTDKNQSLMVCETCEPCYPSLQESIAARQSHCIQCNEPSKIDCESCLNGTNNSSQFAVDTQMSSEVCQDTSCCECEYDEKVAGGSCAQVYKQSQMICETCEPCYPSLQESMATMEEHCVECAEPDKIECESCLDRTNEGKKSFTGCLVTFQAVETQISSQSCRDTRCCECEDEKVTPSVASDRPNDVIICDSCKNKQYSRSYANASTKISFVQSNKQIQCRNSELQSTNNCPTKESCQSHQCCECDDDDEPKTMDDETVCADCEPCIQSIEERKTSDEVHCLECSNPNEILCESCLEIGNKQGGQIIDKKSVTSFKCNECIGEKCAPTECRSCEDRRSATSSKVSEINSATYCQLCEQCKDSFSKTSEITHCSTCADITNIQCESCLEIENKERHRIKEHQLDAKIIYELVCETCKQLSGDKDSSDKGRNSIKKMNKSSDSCMCDVKCSRTDCQDCEANKKIINEYFSQQQSSKSDGESKTSQAKLKDGNATTSISFADGTKKGPQTKNSTFGCIYCEACEDCQNDNSSKENGQYEDNCLDCIDINNILCESCLNLTNKQNRTAGAVSQSSQKSQQLSKTLFKINSSENKHEENCMCCVCTDNWSTEQDTNNVVTKEEIAIEKHSAMTDKLKETLSCSCSRCIDSKKQQMASSSRGINSELNDEVPTKIPHIVSMAVEELATRCCLEPECAKCGQSKNKRDSHDVISVTVSLSCSETSTGDYTSHSIGEPELNLSHCSGQNVLELDGASISCQPFTDGQASKSNLKCSCHVSTNTSKPTAKCGGSDRNLDIEQKPPRKVANSPKGECSTALKYKLSSNDRASDYVLLDGPVFIKKSCVGGKDKVHL
ncbi:unnamed protein product [Callosobruchus maculatus]|uniref:Uncharacterized protein n=1 Tax=Callosobruchus maculatus TaxID=64391 RepID=A0A653DB78_CALMS|nr:unnamed protein product [Callosobruchus maculatus]